MTDLRTASALFPGRPLWQRVPSSDADGRLLADFMILIPGLKRWSAPRQRRAAAQVNAVLGQFAEELSFVDLNLQLGVLWVSGRARAGLCADVTLALQAHLPEARLVAHQGELKRRPRGLLADLRGRLRGLLGFG